MSDEKPRWYRQVTPEMLMLCVACGTVTAERWTHDKFCPAPAAVPVAVDPTTSED